MPSVIAAATSPVWRPAVRTTMPQIRGYDVLGSAEIKTDDRQAVGKGLQHDKAAAIVEAGKQQQIVAVI